MPDDFVEILMATHNGEKYLVEQIESILNQDYKNLVLTIRDDASTDSTKDILENFSASNPGEISVFYNEKEPDGPITNFSKLISMSERDYIMLSDQDDFWYQNKISLLFNKLKRIESRTGKDKPLLVHSDLSVANKHLEIMHPSFWKYSGLRYKSDTFGRLLIQNVITGSASLFNRALVKICTPIPNEAIMHDWWIALAASAFGEIGVIKQPTTLYRQHESNVLGASDFSGMVANLPTKIVNVFSFKRKTTLLQTNKTQAIAFLQSMGNNLTPKQRKQLKILINLNSYNIFMKRYNIIRYDLLFGTFLQNLGWFIAV